MILALLRTPAVRYALAGIGIVLLIAFVILRLTAAEKADDRANQQAGATAQREADLQATVENVRKADEAAETVRRDPVARNAECLRNSRTPENCR